jgi:hypothetical protein
LYPAPASPRLVQEHGGYATARLGKHSWLQVNHERNLVVTPSAIARQRKVNEGFGEEDPLVASGERNVMLTLMKKGPWNKPKKSPAGLVVDEKFRHYWISQNRRYRRRRLIERLGLSALAAVGGCAAVWAFLSYGPALPSLPLLSFLSSPSAAQVTSIGPFRNCAAARAAGAAPLHRGQPGYAYHLDADGDGIACEWSWRNWFW